MSEIVEKKKKETLFYADPSQNKVSDEVLVKRVHLLHIQYVKYMVIAETVVVAIASSIYYYIYCKMKIKVIETLVKATVLSWSE